jgi:hypothetical protein
MSESASSPRPPRRPRGLLARGLAAGVLLGVGVAASPASATDHTSAPDHTSSAVRAQFENAFTPGALDFTVGCNGDIVISEQ